MLRKHVLRAQKWLKMKIIRRILPFDGISPAAAGFHRKAHTKAREHNAGVVSKSSNLLDGKLHELVSAENRLRTV